MRLCVIPGDGIGREVVPAAVAVLQELLPDLEIVQADGGWDCFQRTGTAMPEATLQAVRTCGAGLFGAVSSPSRAVTGYRSAILTLRRELELFANVRPVRSLPGLTSREDVDLIVVRENTEGLYVGRERSEPGGAVAERRITEAASRRIGARALDLACGHSGGRLTIVHKANVLPLTDGLFRDSVRAVIGEAESPRVGDLIVDELLVDVAALKLLEAPQRFGVIVTTNLFGDILSDAAAHWCGGLGLAPSLNWGEGVAVAEPVHGSAPDIAGTGAANPAAAILSAALLVRHVWQRPAMADLIEGAVRRAMQASGPAAGTAAIGDAVRRNLEVAAASG
ncbi:isocitrate/isopropylmalate dehydrogenase family protein [Sulfidibacter corallicola]|uniref:Isocitrate/isopropylmalate dehydrogenase family protein n=1 Tax=Sulfidibacter corallicola TaxID=2818388 RepID=A0A8A4TDS3_SULCO|nr:isocitrate/isopropylmalate family dehydrogenase [Sulfidibacter corallicola]QTD47710.1 isocitrate/isopropylmalate dehydrogenase family protein [Sulfidibacter corallicola]